MQEALKRLLCVILLTFRSIILLHRAMLSSWILHVSTNRRSNSGDLVAKRNSVASIREISDDHDLLLFQKIILTIDLTFAILCRHLKV